jgi:A/G-specific adenine glycosylase
MHNALAAWFSENQRPLPWRLTYDPYQVWVSEVMLQQTQVETALPYYERFIRELPDIHALAAADEQRVLTLWAGLGYYSRARNLMAAARIVERDYGAVLPDDYERLRELPGIGRYMAGAILSIAFNKPYPIVDGNVRRVLSRIHGWDGDDPNLLWDAAARLVQHAEPRTINQAVMELGAKVCSLKSPRCLVCPVHTFCAAFKTGQQDRFPKVKKRPATVPVYLVAVVQGQNGRVLMQQTDGLWEFPTFNSLPSGALTKSGTCRHTITHHRLTVTVYTGTLEQIGGFQWQDFNSVPVSSLTRKVFLTACSARNNLTAIGGL